MKILHFIVLIIICMTIPACKSGKPKTEFFKIETDKIQDSLIQVRRDVGLMALAIRNIADYIDNEDAQLDIQILSLAIMSYSLPEFKEDKSGKYVNQEARKIMNDIIDYNSVMARDIIRGHSDRNTNGTITPLMSTSGTYGKDMNEQTVYICTGGSSKRYHATSRCRGLNSCGGTIEQLSISDAEDMNRTPCQICY